MRNGIEQAMHLDETTTALIAGMALGNGSRISAADTVPFVLWNAARSLRTYEEAMWQTVSGDGDKDTTCAMVGGIVALAAGRESIPESWLDHREPIAPLLTTHLSDTTNK